MYPTIASDIDRLVSYAESLGFSVKFKKPSRGSRDAGEFVFDSPPQIIIYQSSKTPKTDVLLTLLHELGHGEDWIERGRPEESMIEIQYSMEDEELTKEDRAVILAGELRAIEKMLAIARRLGLKIPEWRVNAEATFDRWIYNYFVVKGHFPTEARCKKQMRRIINKLKTTSSLSSI